MKRSEINAALREMEQMVREYRFALPPLCGFTPEEWAEGMLLRHIRRTPPENDNFSLVAVFVEECG